VSPGEVAVSRLRHKKEPEGKRQHTADPTSLLQAVAWDVEIFSLRSEGVSDRPRSPTSWVTRRCHSPHPISQRSTNFSTLFPALVGVGNSKERPGAPRVQAKQSQNSWGPF
jgi:hypothetical protein